MPQNPVFHLIIWVVGFFNQFFLKSLFLFLMDKFNAQICHTAMFQKRHNINLWNFYLKSVIWWGNSELHWSQTSSFNVLHLDGVSERTMTSCWPKCVQFSRGSKVSIEPCSGSSEWWPIEVCSTCCKNDISQDFEGGWKDNSWDIVPVFLPGRHRQLFFDFHFASRCLSSSWPR